MGEHGQDDGDDGDYHDHDHDDGDGFEASYAQLIIRSCCCPADDDGGYGNDNGKVK